jgi:DeoR/GlpR family transcriptional regulator of sugar metabolism
MCEPGRDHVDRPGQGRFRIAVGPDHSRRLPCPSSTVRHRHTEASPGEQGDILPAAEVLSRHAKAECVVVGGRLFKAARVAVGIAAVDAYRMLRPDSCVLGAAGIHPEAGVTTFDGEEAEVKRAMVEHAARVIVVVAGEKLRTVAPYLLTPITKMTHLVTDRTASPDMLRTLSELGIEVVIA